MIIELVDWNRENRYLLPLLDYVEGSVRIIKEVGSHIFLAPSRKTIVLSIVMIIRQVDCGYHRLSEHASSPKLLQF
jgi:hypothetical protein